MRILILAAVMLSLTFAPASLVDAKVYKWKDENGKWHYSDNPSKIPPSQAPKINKPPASKSLSPNSLSPKSPSTSHKSSDSSRSMEGEMAKGMEEGFEKMGEALGKGLAEGMQKMGEEMGKAFGGMGEMIALAAANQPDEKKTAFANKEEEVLYEVKEVLLGMFMFCQFQYVVAKSETCTKEGPKEKDMKGWKMKDDPEREKKLAKYFIDIVPEKSSRENLLIIARHKQYGDAWEITHKGKPSLAKSARQIQKRVL